MYPQEFRECSIRATSLRLEGEFSCLVIYSSFIDEGFHFQRWCVPDYAFKGLLEVLGDVLLEYGRVLCDKQLGTSYRRKVAEKFVVESRWETSTRVDDLDRDDTDGSHCCQCPVAGPRQLWA